MRRHGAALDDPRLLLGGAVLLRLTLLPTLPDLSDDLYRYVWDGRVTLSGANPYLFVPESPELAHLQDGFLLERMNSPGYHSVYPPLSQLVFLMGGALHERVGWAAAAFGIKIGFLCLELIGILFLAGALRALRIPLRNLAWYAWNPLPLLVVAGGGHTEGGLVAGMGILAWGVASGHRRTAWIGLVLAAASKGVPLLLAPLLLRHHLGMVPGRRSRALAGVTRDALPGIALGLALLLPFLRPGVGEAVSGSADLYVRHFEFNAGLYFLLKRVGILLTGHDWGSVIGPSLRWAFLGMAAVLVLRWRAATPQQWIRGALALFGLYLVTATTVHPWYLLWGLVLVPLTSFTRPAWLWASWATFLTYLTYLGVPHGPLAGVVWSGVGILLLRESGGLRRGEAALRDRLLRLAGRRKARQVDRWVPEGAVLDLGAGEGYVGAGLAGPERRVILGELGPWWRVELPGFVHDGRTLPLADRSVDTVLLSLVLHHAEDPDQVLREAARVARHRVVVTESTYRWEWERRLLAHADRLANRTRGMDREGAAPLRFRTVEGWERAFARAGLELRLSRRLNRIGHRHHLFVLEPRGDGGAVEPR